MYLPVMLFPFMESHWIGWLHSLQNLDSPHMSFTRALTWNSYRLLFNGKATAYFCSLLGVDVWRKEQREWRRERVFSKICPAFCWKMTSRLVSKQWSNSWVLIHAHLPLVAVYSVANFTLNAEGVLAVVPVQIQLWVFVHLNWQVDRRVKLH